MMGPWLAGALLVAAVGALALAWRRHHGVLAEAREARALAELAWVELERARLAQELERFFTLSLDGFCIATRGPEGHFKHVNAAFSKMLGWSEAELLGRPRMEFVHPDDRERTRAQAGTVASGGSSFHFENRYLCRDGSYRWLSWTALAHGDVVYGVARDMTEQKRAEDALREAQKMQAHIQLAGGICHQFNNLLSVIQGSAELLLLGHGDVPSRQRHLERIVQAGKSAGALTGQLLAFTQKQVLQPQVVDVAELVARLEPALRALVGERVDLRVERACQGPLAVKVDPRQLETVLTHLASNARDAMPSGGTLTIELGEDGAAGVKIDVRDTGAGMDAATLARLFEPFFTTKEIGKGTGLGLATVYGIVQQSGGTVQVQSRPGAGTTVTIRMPRVEARASAPGTFGRAPVDRATRTILIAEDDAEVRSVLVEVLESEGYRVLEAGDGDQAIRASAEYQGPIDLLVTDVLMPGANGREVAEQVTKARPGIKVLFVSGYSDRVLIEQGVLGPGTDFIAKPFGIDVLVRKVGDFIGARPRRDA